MPKCDVCNSSTSFDEGTQITADNFRKLVSQGFEPDEKFLRAQANLGIPKQKAIAQWKNGIVANSKANWLLCPSCFARTEDRKVLLEVKNLVKYFPVRGGLLQRVQAWVQAVDDVSFHIYEGETLGLVGESGCGKTTVGRTILNLVPATSGEVIFNGEDVFSMNAKQMKKLRREMQIIFQDPYSSLDPRLPVGESIAEGLNIHTDKKAQERYDVVVEMLTRVGMRADHARRYPHEFSGGQRQRIGIARALALRPKFIVCDEPVSALDVSIQAQVLNILKDLQRDFGLTYLFIAHNLSVVEHFSDRVGVMYLGKMAEMATREELYRDPLHPYTQALMSAIPVPDPAYKRQRVILQGDVPSPLNPPTGCRFHTRCPLAFDKCSQETPPFKDYGDEHYAACWLLETGEKGASKLTVDKVGAENITLIG